MDQTQKGPTMSEQGNERIELKSDMEAYVKDADGDVFQVSAGVTAKTVFTYDKIRWDGPAVDALKELWEAVNRDDNFASLQPKKWRAWTVEELYSHIWSMFRSSDGASWRLIGITKQCSSGMPIATMQDSGGGKWGVTTQDLLDDNWTINNQRCGVEE